MSIEDDLQEFISRQILLDGGNVAPDEPLMSTGKVDSLGLLEIMRFLDERYKVDLLEVGGPDDFETINGIANAVRRVQHG